MSECCKCSLRFNGKHFTGSFKNRTLQVGDVVQQGRDIVITEFNKQDGAIVTTFHNREMFGVYILLNLIVFLWGGFEDHSCNPVCLV